MSRPELIGKFGVKARRWKGLDASYAAKHMWLTKHYTKPDACEGCHITEFTRLEWANLSGDYKRDRSDYKALCPSCHRKKDLNSTYCKNGHERLAGNTKYRNGWKVCQDCNRETQRRYRNAKANKV